MTLDYSTLANALVSPQIWWVYEMGVVFAFFLIQFFRKWGKDMHLIGDFDKAGTFHVMAQVWSDPLKKIFKTRGGRYFFAARATSTMTWERIGGSARVVLHDISKARPRYADIMNKGELVRAQEGTGEANIVVDPMIPLVKTVTQGGKKIKYVEQDDPTVADFTDWQAGETKRQVSAGSTGAIQYGKLMLIMACAIGAALGAFGTAAYLTHGFQSLVSSGAGGSLQCPQALIRVINGTQVCG